MWPDNPEITFVACRRSMPVRRGNCLCFVRLFVLQDYIDLAGIKACEFKIEADMVVSRSWWKFEGGVLRACEGSVSQAARSRGIGSMG